MQRRAKNVISSNAPAREFNYNTNSRYQRNSRCNPCIPIYAPSISLRIFTQWWPTTGDRMKGHAKKIQKGGREEGEWRNGSVVHATAPLQHCPFALIVAIQRQFVTGLEKEGAVAKAGTLVTQGRIKVISCPLRYGWEQGWNGIITVGHGETHPRSTSRPFLLVFKHEPRDVAFSLLY